MNSDTQKEPITLKQNEYENMGDAHVMTSIDTPLQKNAFDASDDQKIRKIQEHFAIIMETLGLDLTDDSLKGTPHRVAKMYVKEIFSGLNPKNKPSISTFENKYQYKEILIEKNITLNSHCEHHFVPFSGKAHVAYIPAGRVIGLSKINRLVQYYAQRPQVQERLTQQILQGLQDALESPDVAVLIDAEHMCVSTRGIKDTGSSTITSAYSGQFKKDQNSRSEFLKSIAYS